MRPDVSHANLKYRPEIDGLRALAVLPVILFHAGFRAFSGGFVGVDVFFVISGYLITSIVANDCRNGAFSLATFYERRARRILPALFIVIAACLPFAYMWMLPAETLTFSRSILAAITFVPNVYFWLTTSYFGAVGEKTPLLHTWSLGVEEQFYVVFPLIVWFVWRFGVRAVVATVAVLALASFGMSEWAWRAGKFSSSFYLAPTRAWELMLGALVALAWQARPIHQRLGPTVSNMVSLVGLGMLVYAVCWFEKTTPTPSIYALLPCVGTCLIIACAGPGTLVHRLLSTPPAVGIGLVSYSAYLWHQPLFAFARLRSAHEPSTTIYAIVIVLSLTLAYLTWRYVENPFRRAATVSRSSLVRASIAFWLVLTACTAASEFTHGFASRVDLADRPLAAMADSDAQGHYVTARFVSMDREFSTQPGALRILVLGDSYAQDFVNAMFEGGDLTDVEVRTIPFLADCQIYLGPNDVSEFIEAGFRSSCAQARERSREVFRRRASQADVVILASSWRRWAAERLPQTLAAMQPLPARGVYIVGPKRIGEINIRELLDMPLAARTQAQQPVSPDVAEIERILVKAAPANSFISMQSAVCGNGSTCRLFTPAGGLISFDGTHLTKDGATYAGRHLLAAPPLSTLMSGHIK